MTDLLQRIAKEAKITLETFRESVIAIAERVNRKVQILILHSHASSVQEQIDTAYHDLGNRLCGLLAQSHDPSTHLGMVAGTGAEMVLLEIIGKIRPLKQELVGIEALVRELEIDTLREDLVALQHDLSTRSALIRRVVVEPEAVANGRTIAQLGLPVTIRVAAILRGPMLISSVEQVDLRSSDIVVLVGVRADLQQSLPLFSHTARGFS
jgi:TrkA-C domain